MVAGDGNPTLEWLRQDYEYKVSLSHIARTPPHTQRQKQECYK